jgi:hypothetical protein
MGHIAIAWEIVKEVFGPQPSIHATDVREYEFSYRKQAFGTLLYFKVNATCQAEADVRAAGRMRELVRNQGALSGSLRSCK